MDGIFRSVRAEAAGISVNHPLAPVLSARSGVMRFTQKVMRSIELFATQVMPHFREVPVASV